MLVSAGAWIQSRFGLPGLRFGPGKKPPLQPAMQLTSGFWIYGSMQVVALEPHSGSVVGG